MLGKIDFGRLSIKTKKGEEIPYYQSDYGSKVENLYCFDCSFTISLYNSSNKNRVLRNATIQFVDENKNEVLTLPIKDLATTRYTSSLYTIDDVGVVNIQSKTGLDIKAKVATRDIEKLVKAKKTYLLYTNEKFKVRKKSMWKFDYSTLELTQQVEEVKHYLKTDEEE